MMPRAKRPFFSDNNSSAVPPSDSNARSLPDADALLHVGSFLNQADFASTKQALGHFLYPKGLFHNTHVFHKVSAAGQLLKATEYADYCQVEDLIADENKLNLMFEPVSFTFRDGSEERISPLRYAFKVYDTYMWKTVFLKRIEEIEDPVKKEAYLKKFFAQMKEQEKAGHIDLEPLFKAYKGYHDQYECWFEGEMDGQDIVKEWYKLGEKQKALLPFHMLKEFSREGDKWRANASFDVDNMPWPLICQVYNYIYDSAADSVCSLSSMLLPDSGWGISFALTRGWRINYLCQQLLPTYCDDDATEDDKATFLRLLEVRSNDFAKQLSLMSQNAPKSQEQQDQRVESVSRLTP